MSNVRLSNGSPTMERTERTDAPRLSSDHPKPSACRSLFGSVDHEELKRDLKGHLHEMEEASTAKWNFDFASHTPLSHGRFEWRLLDCKDVPDFYSRPPQRSAKGVYCPSGNNNVDLNGNHNNCVVVTQTRQTSENTESQMESREQCTGQRKRPACHDPSSQNKRSHTSPDDVTRCPGLTHSVEHTPRKAISPKTQT